MTNKQTTLVVDSNERNCFWLGLNRKDKDDVIKKYDLKAQELQKSIKQFLFEEKLALGDIDAVAFVRRAGSLTGSRIGAVTVNTFTWLENISIFDLKAPSIESVLGILKNKKTRGIAQLTQVD